MRAVLVRARSLWRALRHRDRLDADMHDEMRCHIDMAHLDLTDPMLVWLFRVAQMLVGALVGVVAVNCHPVLRADGYPSR